MSTRNSSSARTQKYTQNTNTLHRRRLAGSLLSNQRKMTMEQKKECNKSYVNSVYKMSTIETVRNTNCD